MAAGAAAAKGQTTPAPAHVKPVVVSAGGGMAAAGAAAAAAAAKGKPAGVAPIRVPMMLPRNIQDINTTTGGAAANGAVIPRKAPMVLPRSFEQITTTGAATQPAAGPIAKEGGWML